MISRNILKLFVIHRLIRVLGKYTKATAHQPLQRRVYTKQSLGRKYFFQNWSLHHSQKSDLKYEVRIFHQINDSFFSVFHFRAAICTDFPSNHSFFSVFLYALLSSDFHEFFVNSLNFLLFFYTANFTIFLHSKEKRTKNFVKVTFLLVNCWFHEKKFWWEISRFSTLCSVDSMTFHSFFAQQLSWIFCELTEFFALCFLPWIKWLFHSV